MLRRTFIGFILVFAIWHFEWICSLFFMSLADPRIYTHLMIWSIIIWLAVLACGLIVLWIYLRIILRHLQIIQSGDASEISDPALRKSLDRILFLPVWTGIVYTVAWWLAGFMALGWWFNTGVGTLATGSLLVGQLAGGLACPSMMIGVIGALSGKATERFTAEALRRNFKFKASRFGLSARLILSFMLFAVGFTVWLGGLGFFSSYRSVVRTLETSLEQRQSTWIAARGGSATPAQWQSSVPALNISVDSSEKERNSHQETHWITAKGENFVSPASGTGGTIPASQTNSIAANLLDEIRSRLAGSEKGSWYDSGQEKVFAWTRLPLSSVTEVGDASEPATSHEALYLVSIVDIDITLTGLTVYLIWLGIFTVAAMLVAPTIAVSNASIVLQGIQSVYAMVRNLGEGNLAVRRGAPGLDESGMLTIDLNHFLASLSEIIFRIRETVGSVVREIQSLENTARELSTGAQSQAAAVEQASASMEEVSSSTREIADMVSDQADRVSDMTIAVTQELGGAIERVAERAVVVNESAEESLTRAQEVRTVNSESIAGMEQIQSSSNDILSIVDVIVQISDKTNLLALNASIEAARAGEAGRGFAVVADEVSRLAEQSNKAIGQIKQLVDINNSRVTQGTQKVGSLGSAIEHLARSAQLARDVGEEIKATTETQRATGHSFMNNITDMDTSAKMIARATGEQTTTTGEMARTLEQINDVAQRTAESADQIAEVVRQLRDESGQLHEITEGFIVRTE